jgi:hypothetical protein
LEGIQPPWRQADASGLPLEQGETQFDLKRANCSRQGRLRDKSAPGTGTEAARVRDGDEIAYLFQVHP